MSNIEWTDESWNPVVGCTRVSAGCDHCYAVTMTHRLGSMAEKDIREKGPGGAGKKAAYMGLTVLNPRGDRHFNGVVRCVEEALDIPLRRKKPTTWFVNSMGDLFHEKVPFEFIDRVFAVMALTPRHTYQILTKRPERMAEYFNRPHPHYAVHEAVDRLCSTLDDGTVPAKLDPLNGRRFIVPRRLWAQAPAFPTGLQWPLPNVWLGTSCEDQAAADERIPRLLRCPAAVRFLSCEPLIGEVDLTPWLLDTSLGECSGCTDPRSEGTHQGGTRQHPETAIHWVIAGGESGKGARPCDIAWIRSIVEQCKSAGVPVFVKQLGARPYAEPTQWRKDDDWLEPYLDSGVAYRISGPCADPESHFSLRDKKGGDMAEWPEDLRVREMPGVRT